MYLRLLFRGTISIELNGLFDLFSEQPMLSRFLVLAVASPLLNPFTYYYDLYLPSTMLVSTLSGIIIATLYVSLLILFSLAALRFNTNRIHDPVVMISAMVLAIPSFNQMHNGLADMLDIGPGITIYQSFLFLGWQFILYQIGMNLIFAKASAKPKPLPAQETLFLFLFPSANPMLKIGRYSIPKKRILWIKSHAHNIQIKTLDDDILVRGSLNKTIGDLTMIPGMLIHRSTWVADHAIRADASVSDARLVTIDGEMHKVARDKQAQLKARLYGHEPKTKTHAHQDAADFPIGAPFRKDFFVTPRQIFLMILDPFILKMVTSIAIILLVCNPFHWTSNMPLSYWLSYWSISSTTFMLVYPGVMVFGIFIARTLRLRSLWEMFPMTIAHFYALFLMYQYGNWISDYLGYSYSYPILGAVFNIFVSELIMFVMSDRILELANSKIENADNTKDDDPRKSFQFSIKKTHLNTRDIYYVKSEGHYLKVSGKGPSSFFLGRIAELSDVVPHHLGISPHRSYWITRHGIDMAHVTNGRLVLTMVDGTEITVSRNRSAVVKDWLISVGVTIK